DEKAVYDGDTFKIDGFSVRVGEVNAPERKPAEAGWEEAQKALEKLVKGKEVTLDYGKKTDPRDDYGRLVARVSVGNKLVPEVLLEQGVAHAYFILNGDDGIDRSNLIAAQEKAKAAKKGIWAQERFQKPFVLTSFHPNGRGDDNWNPNVEYMRLCNVASDAINLKGYSITNASGQKWTLPDVSVPVGHTVQIFSGRGESQLTPPKAIKIFLGEQKPVWDNYLDKMTFRDAKGSVILDRAQNQDPPNLEKLASELTITQKQIGRLGSDVDVVYEGPAKLVVKDFVPDDGDTIYIPQLKTGTFKASIGKFKWDLAMNDGDQAPKDGTMGVRFQGVDTLETRVVKIMPDGEKVFASQGMPGEIAKKAMLKLLAKADKIYVVPDQHRPFDVYDRLLGTVFAEIGTGAKKQVVEVNKWLVEQGHGELVSYYGKDFDPARHEAYAKASKEAFEAKRGIYGDGDEKMLERPADFRRRMADRPPSRDYVADWETKLVYPSTHIDMVPPYRRVFILHDDLSPALLDARFSFKLAKVEPKTSTPASVKGSKAKAVRALDLQISQKAGREIA
ncbi:MAG TPA: thermonuclease family protein, partial [Myxococcota bacterium]|nr:thermonuclease family protein [Myxococcota bacterium]